MSKILCSSFALGVYNKREIVATPNFRGIVGSVLILLVFHYVHFLRFGDLNKRFLDVYHYS